MNTIRIGLFFVGVLFLCGTIIGQDAKKETKDSKDNKDTAKAKGVLPQNWSKIGLTDEQKQKVYIIDAKFDKQIDELIAKIKELKDDKRKEQLKVLTDDQKKRLEEIIKKAAGTDK
jgi:glucan phosphorylase